MGTTDRALTRFKLLVRALLNAQEEFQDCLVVIIELVGVQGVDHEAPVDETNSEADLEFCKLGRSDLFNLEWRINSC